MPTPRPRTTPSRGHGTRAPDVATSLQRLQVNPPEEHLGAFGLEQDLAFGVAAHGTVVDDVAVENVGDIAPLADAFEGVPFAGRLFHVLFAAEAEHVLPVGIAIEPVDAAARELLLHSAGLVVGLHAALGAGGPILDFARQLGHVLAFDEDEVAGAALDHLALDRFEPDPAGGAVFADAMEQDAAVARRLFSRRPGLVAPLELDHEVIVLVLLLGHEAAVNLAGNADHAVRHAEDLERIVVLAERLVAFLFRTQICVEVGQVLAVEHLDLLGHRFGFETLRGQAEPQATDHHRHRRKHTFHDATSRKQSEPQRHEDAKQKRSKHAWHG